MAQQPSLEGRTAEVLALKARLAEECQLSKEPGISCGLEAALAALAGQVWSSQPSGTNLVLKLPAEIDLAEVLCTTLPKRLVTAAALAHHPAAVLSYARALLCSYTSGDAAALGVFGELAALADAVGGCSCAPCQRRVRFRRRWRVRVSAVFAVASAIQVAVPHYPGLLSTA